jgi:N-acetylmuramoyl-L-alanine amidase
MKADLSKVGLRKVNKIVIHCTATPQDTKVSSILNYWKNDLKWRRPGYHILIDAAGGKHYLAPFEDITNGVAGHNALSVHISYIGGVDAKGKPLDTRTDLQKARILDAIREVIYWMRRERLHLDGLEIVGHRDLAAKACPSFDAKKEYSWIMQSEGYKR